MTVIDNSNIKAGDTVVVYAKPLYNKGITKSMVLNSTVESIVHNRLYTTDGLKWNYRKSMPITEITESLHPMNSDYEKKLFADTEQLDEYLEQVKQSRIDSIGEIVFMIKQELNRLNSNAEYLTDDEHFHQVGMMSHTVLKELFNISDKLEDEMETEDHDENED